LTNLFGIDISVVIGDNKFDDFVVSLVGNDIRGYIDFKITEDGYLEIKIPEEAMNKENKWIIKNFQTYLSERSGLRAILELHPGAKVDYLYDEETESIVLAINW